MFAGKHGFITPRDLFRWAGRGAVGYQQVATFMHMRAGASADCVQSLGNVHGASPITAASTASCRLAGVQPHCRVFIDHPPEQRSSSPPWSACLQAPAMNAPESHGAV